MEDEHQNDTSPSCYDPTILTKGYGLDKGAMIVSSLMTEARCYLED